MVRPKMRFCGLHHDTPGALSEGGAGISLSALERVAARVSPPVERRGDVPVIDVTDDSRQVRPGWLFAARRGISHDGHDSAPDAVRRGAAAVMVERFVDLPVPQLRVGSTRAALGPVASAAHGEPSLHLPLVGITGTNGKTTLAYLLAAACAEDGRAPGVIGTVETRIGNQSAPAILTTPAAPDLQRTLASMRSQRAGVVVMEVSSHALDQQRVAGCRYALSVFTTLEPEHLDYHGTMAHYYASKAKLFSPTYTEQAVVCVDSAWGQRLAAQARVPVLRYGRDSGAEVRYCARSRGLEGIEVETEGRTGRLTLRSAIVGVHNAPNVVGAYLAAVHLGVDARAAAIGIAACPRPPGRFEIVHAGQEFIVAADYAHTPDSLRFLVDAARELARPNGRVRLVAGARGGRDRYKRQDLARAAATADWAVMTADNPGDEDPRSIMNQLRAGLIGIDAGHVTVDPDRVAAIRLAVSGARAGDVVVIAGRGHESQMRVAGRVVDLDDRQVAAEAVTRCSDRP